MTHSLHRQGSIESLKDDFVMYARASRGFNMDTAAPKVRRIVEIIFDVGPNNLGHSSHNASICAGTLDRDTAVSWENDRGIICCFEGRENMKRVLERLKEEDLGISIVVSGVIDDVKQMAREVGLKPHTINLSLGVWGKKELLPGPDVLEMNTMCGHGLIARDLVTKAMAEVKAGKISTEEAARMVGKPCVCGIFNMARGARLLEKSAASAG